ncbi:MAG TPA: type II toxin-antitoxin system VapC family toxin [Trueperaceae bacterium]
MILDSSAIIAILVREPEWDRLLNALEGAATIGCGAPTLAETGIVLGNRYGFESAKLHRFVQEFAVETVTFGGDHWSQAVRAYERYGKGRHKAGLNFGDCLAYSVAKLSRLPLLFVGSDFAETDLEFVSY